MDNNCTPRLLLHSCCGPCSTYCIQTLSEYFKVTVFYYNPNIYPPEEYQMRAQEQKRFIDEFPVKNPVHFVEGVYDTKRFYDMTRGRRNPASRMISYKIIIITASCIRENGVVISAAAIVYISDVGKSS